MASQFAAGTQDGTGAAITIQLGWVPDYVLVQNWEATDFGSLLWVKGMAQAAAIKQLTSTGSLLTTLGISTNAGSGQLGATAAVKAGFIIGADTDVNVSGESITWIAMRNMP